MSLASDKVVSLGAYRALRASQRPARPFLMWYPGVGFVRSDAHLGTNRSPDRGGSKFAPQHT